MVWSMRYTLYLHGIEYMVYGVYYLKVQGAYNQAITAGMNHL